MPQSPKKKGPGGPGGGGGREKGSADFCKVAPRNF